MSLRQQMANLFFRDEVKRQVRAMLAAEDDSFTLGAHALGSSERDRYTYDREQILEQALDAWRVNPLARRIVGLTSQYVVGGGVTFACKHAGSGKFLQEFWNHPLNRMPVRVIEWCDELTRTGNLFVLVTTDAAGMSYVRAIPAAQVKELHAAENDIERALSITVVAAKSGALPGDEVTYTVYDPLKDQPNEDGSFAPVVLHYAINRPAGAQWGESDLAPILRWLSRYNAWLEDRARLNRFRTAFLYVVKAKFISEAERASRQNALNATPPSPGSILVTDESETWDVISPKLEADDANTDGLALKKMIAAGSGVPLHFLAEPESATRTTAEAAGGPTYRWFEQRQEYFTWMLTDLLCTVAARRSLVDRRVNRQATIEVHGADISARDNVSLAMAASNILGVLTELRGRGLIDDSEFLRLVYRFCGETVDVEEMLRRGKEEGAAPNAKPAAKPASDPSKVLDVETGEPKSAIDAQ
jgi:hypothetical protein